MTLARTLGKIALWIIFLGFLFVLFFSQVPGIFMGTGS
jgi:hypothetical protein